MAQFKDGIDIGQLVEFSVIGYGIFTISKLFKKDENKSKDGNSSTAPPAPPAYQVGENATITLDQAYTIAESIKKKINDFNFRYDVQAIDKYLWTLQNDDDVDALHTAFGIFDGPGLLNGNIFECLSYFRESYVLTNGYQANWDSIKRHLYGRGNQLSW